MAQNFEQADGVKWNTPQGETFGKVKKKLTTTEVGAWRGLDDEPAMNV